MDFHCHALVKWQQNSMRMEYDEQTGTGRFVIVDGDAPEPGSTVELHDTITPCESAALTLKQNFLSVIILHDFLIDADPTDSWITTEFIYCVKVVMRWYCALFIRLPP